MQGCGGPLQPRQQHSPLFQPLRADVLKQLPSWDTKIGSARIASDQYRIELFSHPSPRLTRDPPILSHELRVPGEHHGGGKPAGGLAVAGDQRGDRRPILRQRLIGCRRTEVLAARVHLAAGGSMDRHPMSHRTKQAELVHLLRHPRQVLTQLDAGDPGGNRLEGSADSRRGVRLHVPQVDVARAAEQK
jgi:hypothetical protein